MSSQGFNATLDLRLRPSQRAVRVVFVLHVVAIGLCFFAASTKWPTLVLGLLLLVSWRRSRRPVVAGYGPGALSHLIWHSNGTAWHVETESGTGGDAELLGDSVVWPLLIVLNFRLKTGTRRTRVLLGDETDADSLRRLRARLLAMADA